MDINSEIGKLSGLIMGIQNNINDRFSATEKFFNEKFNAVQYSLGDNKADAETNKKLIEHNEKRIAALELIISNCTSSWKIVSGAVVGSGAVIAFIVTTVMYWLKG